MKAICKKRNAWDYMGLRPDGYIIRASRFFAPLTLRLKHHYLSNGNEGVKKFIP